MTLLHADIARLQNEQKYARYRKVDLHVHTPVSAWCWNQHRNDDTPPAGALSPDDVAEAILATDLDIVAITDHDTVEWVDSVTKAVRKKAPARGRSITVLPGVEVTTYDGVHLLGIFPVGTPIGGLRNMLIRFGLKADGVASERARSEWPLDKVAQEIEKEGGLVVAPHALNPELGIWGGENSRHKGKRTRWLEDGCARILACQPGQRDKLLGAIQGTGIARRFSIIRHSDAHSFDEIGVNATYIKMAEPTVEGLRQVIHEPALRVSFSTPAEPVHPRLLGVELDGGYFSKELLVFSPHLNTLVGTNHAGKSAVVDAIRYAFDDRCFDSVVERQRLLARINGILTDGRVRVWFVGADGHSYRVDREVAIHKTGKGPRDSLQATVLAVVSRLDGDVEMPVDSTPADLLSLDFYGQGAVGQIAFAEDSHRNLVDAMAGTAMLAASLDAECVPSGSIIQALQENARLTQEAEEQFMLIQGELAQLPELMAVRDALQGQAKSDVFSGWEEWQSAARAIGRLETDVRNLNSQIADATIEEEQVRPLPEMVGVPQELDALLEPVRVKRAEFIARVAKARQALSQEVAEAVTGLRDAITTFRVGEVTHVERVKEQLSSLNLTSQAALMSRINELSGKIEQLEQLTTPKLAKAEQRVAELAAERATLLAQFSEEWGKLRDRRRGFVEFLNGATGDELRIDYTPAADTVRYWKRLEAVIAANSSRGASVQKRDREIQFLVEKLEPPALVELLLGCQVDALIEKAGVTANTAEFLCGLPTVDKLSLLTVPHDDTIIIKYRRNDEPQYAALADLSPGERALALLTVAFVNTKGPIVIDQPEDELGQALVTSQLVDTIRRRKQERQFLVVTHNANIPVLGDAEGIFCLRNEYDAHNDVRRCFVDAVGAIECAPVKEVLLGLEGGKESFVQRQAKYNIA